MNCKIEIERTSQHTLDIRDLQSKPSLNDKEPVLDIVAANMNKVLHDPSKAKGSA